MRPRWVPPKDVTGAGRARAQPPRTGASRRACHPWPAQSRYPAPSAQRPLRTHPHHHTPVRSVAAHLNPGAPHAAYRRGHPRRGPPWSARPAGGGGRHRPGADPTGAQSRPGRPRRAAPGARATMRSAVEAAGKSDRRQGAAGPRLPPTTTPQPATTPQSTSPPPRPNRNALGPVRTEVTAPW